VIFFSTMESNSNFGTLISFSTLLSLHNSVKSS
jgi:hypothetical protein